MSQSYIIHGRLFASTQSESVEAELHCLEGGSLEIKAEETKVYSRDDLLNISDRLGTIPRKLTFENGIVFETIENDLVDQLFKGDVSKVGFFANKFESLRAGSLIIIVLAVFISGYILYQFGMPIAAKIAAHQTPEFITEKLDSTTLSGLDQLITGTSKLSAERQDLYRAEFEKLIEQARRLDPDLSGDYNLQFRDGGELGANAFALPGGTIVATDQFINLTETVEEVTAVLAHEIGHVDLKHGLQQIYRSIGIYLVIGMISGGGIDLTEEILGQGAVLLQLNTSRGFESEADEYAVNLLKFMGKDPTALAGILERLTSQHCHQDECESGPEWLSTHPASKQRIEAIVEQSR
ncbi:M48 family metallopeptidase [Lentilitoribacter sp. Alg239-R112]|uniref:M48 family metallopeptidase n=1 Tax=Lentilitoribacter sp. Alg239-R112 TaxID=2305987 RepID=UPI0013A6B8A7|nr:M48 family metallopeptidase [Lentilitoribacter sp. Alg239-R112]